MPGIGLRSVHERSIRLTPPRRRENSSWMNDATAIRLQTIALFLAMMATDFGLAGALVNLHESASQVAEGFFGGGGDGTG
jgi:hypothetical protein